MLSSPSRGGGNRAIMTKLLRGLASGERCLGHADLDLRVRRIASGLLALGVKAGDCMAILMRNDIAFMEASFAAQTVGACTVPINWHFKVEEVAYILADCSAKVLLGHADLLAPIAGGLPPGLATIAVATPPEVAAAYGIAPLAAAAVPGALDYEAWLGAEPAYLGPGGIQPLTMFYTSGTTGHPRACDDRPPRPRKWPPPSACDATFSASCLRFARPFPARSITRPPTPLPCARAASANSWCCCRGSIRSPC